MLAGAAKLGLKIGEAPFFDTVRIQVADAAATAATAVHFPTSFPRIPMARMGS